jgi:hypothetical protein
MNRFFFHLRKSLESYSHRLKQGKMFHPRYLKKRAFTKRVFPLVARRLADRLRLHLGKEITNPFPQEWDVGTRERVDYVIGNPRKPKYFLELESVNRAQLYLFLADDNKKDASKLWYYYATLCKRRGGDLTMPRYFVFLLILPDEPIGTFPFWDAHEYKLFNRRLRKIIQANPFSFYDRMIKTSARLFLGRSQWIINEEGEWEKAQLKDFQNCCELVLMTCTGRQLILSRGKDGFDPAKERIMRLQWK